MLTKPIYYNIRVGGLKFQLCLHGFICSMRWLKHWLFTSNQGRTLVGAQASVQIFIFKLLYI